MGMKRTTQTELRRLILLGLIVAIKIVLGRFTVGPTYVQVGLGFVGSVLLGYLFGPWWGALGGGVSDLVASAIFGNSGGFFIGFTLTAMAGPLLYGLLLYRQPVKLWRVVVATFLVTVIVNLGMNTWWIHLMYHAPFAQLLAIRGTKELIVPWIQMAMSYLVLKLIARVNEQRHIF
ncbi:MAG: folate family ECF transporter S component [Lactobacillus sp.]|nr:folate family ECF transporter S component [Lactobacillus sp.]MDN6052690.1 folate family ECF transporter S component [Lactobacillus sp.]